MKFCEQCHDKLTNFPTIIECFYHGDYLTFCTEECCQEYLYDWSEAMEIDNPGYVEEDDEEELNVSS